MVGGSYEIRRLMGIVSELCEAPIKTFGLSKSPEFDESFKKHVKVFPDLGEKLKKFIDLKTNDPLNSKYGKHDGPFKSGTPLAGFSHCHLRDDAVLIYSLKNQTVNLILIVSHSEMEGKSTMKLAKRISSLK